LLRTAGESWMRVAEDRARWREQLERPMYSSGLRWADDDEAYIGTDSGSEFVLYYGTKKCRYLKRTLSISNQLDSS
jgi:phenylacetate-coenzyme A ligase PaaK-like adenylate-forming protein